MKCIQILQNGFEIFKVGLFLVPALEKFRVVGVGTVDYVRRTNHEIERIFLQKIVKILSKMKLQSDLNAEMDGNLILVSLF